MTFNDLLAPESVTYFVTCIQTTIKATVAKPGVVVLVGGGTWQHRTQVLRAFATTHHYYYVSLGLQLSRTLEPVAPEHRPRRVADLTRTLTRPPVGEEILGSVLDHIEILLFLPDLRVRVVALLRHLARTQPLVVSWPGQHKDNRLIYATPAHPEYQEEGDDNTLYIDLEA